ncbi:flagellar protein FlaG [Pseudomonas sp. 148P]|uniref:Flagellar protein FlaG n=1 Tax=Pseudomonas ulcerans TaxID=3115852 RepID=A0ABU7HXA2_9PSED|nr:MULTISPECIES: flagellar protein FlaG [unclassified Pseudomonas]MEE1920395.1 flagellar protein FlaG [Pseudomonas sp. 147P]MEE1936186.1 flagellar protein FlaG [Pseudomonas sp. 148P]
MDMSVRLNASYPAPAAVAAQQDKPAEQGASEKVHGKPSLAAVDNEKKQTDTDLREAVKGLQDYVQSLQRNLEFSVDESTGTTVVKVVARDSGEVIRQIPSETALELAKSLQDVNSLLFDEKV